jgi:hypothetical protein
MAMVGGGGGGWVGLPLAEDGPGSGLPMGALRVPHHPATLNRMGGSVGRAAASMPFSFLSDGLHTRWKEGRTAETTP